MLSTSRFIIYLVLSLFISTVSYAKNEGSSIDHSQIIKGLVFVSNERDINKDIGTAARGVVIEDLFVPKKEKFKNIMQQYIGMSLTMEELSRIKEEIVKYYVDYRYPLVTVLIPASQDISSGNVQMLVLLSKLGKINVEGAKHSNPSNLKKQIVIKGGEIIDSSQVLDDVTWLDNDPFRSVDIIYEEGEKLGTTDIIINVNDRLPFRTYCGYELAGYRAAGSSRWKVGFNLGRLWRTDQQLNCEYITAENPRRWWSLNAKLHYTFAQTRHI